MRNIIGIFKGDLKKIRNNVVALITIIGLIVIPSLYAWFNIAASWDPYKNTGNLQVAVANTDVGYTGDLIPISINLGDQVVSTLHENTMLDWVFVDEDDAIEGVESGEYYAAIVIPETFSQDMMSLFSTDVQHSALVYYSNQKKSAIAPKVTDKTTTKVQNMIDEIFTQSITEIGIDLMESISSLLDSDSADELMGNFLTNLSQIQTDLNSAAATVSAFSNMTGSINTMLTTTSGFLDDAGNSTNSDAKKLSEIGSGVSSLGSAIDGSTEAISDMLDQTKECYSTISSDIDTAFDRLGSDTQNVKSGIAGLDNEVGAIKSDFTGFRDTLQDLQDSLPEDETVLRKALSSMIGKLDESIARQEKLSSRLESAENAIDSTVSDVENSRSELKKLAEDTMNDIGDIRTDYEDNVKGELDDLYSSLKKTTSSVKAILNDLDDSTDDIATLADDAATSVEGLQDVLDDTAKLLKSGAKQIGKVRDDLEDALESDDLDAIKNILGSDPDDISSFLSAPVSLNTIELYPVENYGSGMAPFYSILAVWVGGILMVAMMKVDLTKERLAALDKPRNYQLYLGRYLLFMGIGLMQGLLTALGDLYFLKIQCLHPGCFILAFLIAGFVFSLIMYTLVISFGDIGKAIAVVLLVIQLGGSGGTFPQEMTPEFFQWISPLLPFTHAINAVRECIAGFYGNTYLIEIGKLGIYVLVCLVLGLVLRTPIIRLNTWIKEEMEKTKVM